MISAGIVIIQMKKELTFEREWRKWGEEEDEYKNEDKDVGIEKRAGHN